MQTFLPYASFQESAKCLDNKRLGKQRVEAKQILQINLFVLGETNWGYCPGCNYSHKDRISGICNETVYLTYLRISDGRFAQMPVEKNDSWKCQGKLEEYSYKTLQGYGVTTPWENHPAVLMWRGWEYWLIQYGLEICREWRKREFKDSLFDFFIEEWLKSDINDALIKPFWLGNKELHNSHKSNLLRKNPQHYSQFNWNVSNNLPYYWPVTKEKRK